MQPPIEVIVACTNQNGIGNKGTIPWDIAADLKFFKTTTTTTTEGKINGVIMGRETFNGIPPRFRPLSGRINVVVSNTMGPIEGVFIAKSFDDAVEYLRKQPEIGKIFAIGGARIYEEAMKRSDCKRLYITKISSPTYECDAFFPAFDETKYKLVSEGEVQHAGENEFRFLIYEKSTAE